MVDSPMVDSKSSTRRSEQHPSPGTERAPPLPSITIRSVRETVVAVKSSKRVPHAWSRGGKMKFLALRNRYRIRVSPGKRSGLARRRASAFIAANR